MKMRLTILIVLERTHQSTEHGCIQRREGAILIFGSRCAGGQDVFCSVDKITEVRGENGLIFMLAQIALAF